VEWGSAVVLLLAEDSRQVEKLPGLRLAAESVSTPE